MTRNKNYIVDTLSDSLVYFYQFVIDGDKLSNKQKIEPYADTLYRDPEYLEQEEVVFGEIKDLRSVLKSVLAYIDVSAIFLSYVNNATIPKPVIESYEELQKLSVPVEIKPVNGKRDLTKARTELPKDIPSMLELFKRVNDYDSLTMLASITGLCEKIFEGNSIGTKKEGQSKTIDISFEDNTKLSSYKKEIQIIADTIQEELKSKNILVTQNKSGKSLSRQTSTKFSTVVNNRTYFISYLIINPCFDYVNLTKPYITLGLKNSSGSDLVFTAQFY